MSVMAKLLNPYPSCPGHPGEYVLYIQRRHRDDPDGNQHHVHIWAAPFAAKKELEILLENDGVVWEGETILRSESGLVIKCDRLQEVWNHEYSLAEMAWQPDTHHRKQIQAVRYQRQPDSIAPVERRQPGERKERTRRTPRPGGMKSIGEVAAELGFKPRDCRAVLRKAKVAKPSHGWAWAPADVDAIKDIIKKGMK